MSVVKPFKGIRPEKDLAQKVAALPYDVMNSDEAREMVKDNPYSFLHVDKAEIDLEKGIDLYSKEVYEKAKDNLNKMIQDSVLIEDAQPNFYIYRLAMDGRIQTGIVACTSVNEYLEGSIKKHELTLEAKEQDRIRHVDICNANTGPIYLAYKNQPEIDKIIKEYTENNQPVYDFTSDDGVGHIVWVIDDKTQIQTIQKEFEKVPALYIADGHHRNASAVKVSLARRAEDPNYDKDAEFNYYLSVIFPANQLCIMDYNRLLKDLNGLTDEQFLNKLKEKFEVFEVADQYKPKQRHTFGLYINKQWYKLVAKSEFINEKDPVASLDVSILQNEVLSKILNIDDPRTNKRIDFVGGIRGLSALEQRVDSGEMKSAFAMYPTSMEELMTIADEDKIMPPKSTWFEPKLRSGLFIHKLS